MLDRARTDLFCGGAADGALAAVHDVRVLGRHRQRHAAEDDAAVPVVLRLQGAAGVLAALVVSLAASAAASGYVRIRSNQLSISSKKVEPTPGLSRSQ